MKPFIREAESVDDALRMLHGPLVLTYQEKKMILESLWARGVEEGVEAERRRAREALDERLLAEIGMLNPASVIDWHVIGVLKRCLSSPETAHVHDDDGTVEGCPGCFAREYEDPTTTIRRRLEDRQRRT